MQDNPRFQQLVAANNPIGEVVAVDRALIRVKGMESVGSGALVLFDNGAQGLVRESGRAGSLVLNLSTTEVPVGSVVVFENRALSVGVGNALVGRVVSASGRPIDGKGPIQLTATRPVFSPAPGVIDRTLLRDRLATGVAMVDQLFPILLGQRIAVLGDSKAGKSTFLTQLGISQLGTGRIVIYCLIAKRKVDVDALVARLNETGAMEHSIVIVSSVFDSLAQSYLAPYTACAIGEHFWFAGRDAIIIYDDLSSHAKVHRELSLLSRRNPGRESYPGDMFYAHSSLLERAGKLSNGGTLTALPVVLTPSNDVTAFLPTSLISITDGQIVFDLERFRQGVRPAVNHGLSVSRVGGRGQNERQKNLTTQLFRRMVDYHQAAEFARFGADMSMEAHEAVEIGKRIYAAFKQPPDVVYSMVEQELFMSAAVNTSIDVDMNLDLVKTQARQIAKSITNEAQIEQAVDQLILAASLEAGGEVNMGISIPRTQPSVAVNSNDPYATGVAS